MIRVGTLLWLVFVSLLGLATFEVKYGVQKLDTRLARVRKTTAAERREIHVLKAEWAYLNQPERLAALNRRFLGLAPITPRQLTRSIADIPFRAPTVPDTMPVGVAVAENHAGGANKTPARTALALLADRPRTLNQLLAEIAEARR